MQDHVYNKGYINLGKKSLKRLGQHNQSIKVRFVNNSDYIEVESKINRKANKNGIRLIGGNKKIADVFRRFRWTRDKCITINIASKTEIEVCLT